MNEAIRMDKRVKLHNAVMIMGLGGWGNAGEASTFAVMFLVDELGATKFGEIPSEKFHDYFIQRPMVSIRQGMIESYETPRNNLFYWVDKKGKVDLVLLLGSEPHLNWPEYTRTVLGLTEEMSVKRVYTIGGYLADIHYEGETPITASTNNAELLRELTKVGVDLTDYKGPTSVYSEILWQARAKRLDVVSLWCAVPMHVSGLYPKAAHDLLQKIALLIGVDLDLRKLKKRVESFEAQFVREARSQPQLRGVLDSLGKRRDADSYIV